MSCVIKLGGNLEEVAPNLTNTHRGAGLGAAVPSTPEAHLAMQLGLFAIASELVVVPSEWRGACAVGHHYWSVQYTSYCRLRLTSGFWRWKIKEIVDK